MAKVQYSAPITALVGSIGGWTFQRNRSGEIARLRPRGLQSPSPKQGISLSLNTQLVAAFTELTPNQKQDWDDFAVANTHQDRFGTVRTLTGQNWFISINRNRLLLSLGILNSPPIHTLPDGNSNFSLTVDTGQILFTKSAPTSPTDTALKIFTTPPLGRSTTSLQSSLRLTRILDTPPFVAIDIRLDWASTHGCQWPPSPVANRFTIGVQLQLVRISTGITIAGNTQLSALVDPLVGVGFWIIETDFEVG